ncbi:hypothetical protein VTJ49DRAFT_1591 [Mycothermus thermophilus]|uniref:Impact N-terminal domain-containing protein n=1 Tax=Humicola insolens TaxID=85995 RepID=A0ABR3VCG1_HUMIN
MATQQDLQELLRLMTVGRKTPMLQAMAQIKALQAADLRSTLGAESSSRSCPLSIKQIAEAPLSSVQDALKDDKGARALQNACKAALKRGQSAATKRDAPDAAVPPAKRPKPDPFALGPSDMTPAELEKSLQLPLCLDEERISRTVIETNRAPLVLAFAVELLRHTMPDQPLSSRLSLAQGVVSANSRSKAVSLGLEKGPSADEEGWGEGQPRVKIMGREIPVLKRGGYEWRGEEQVGAQPEPPATEAGTSTSEKEPEPDTKTQTSPTSTVTAAANPTPPPFETETPTWAVSPPITLKDSTFIARAIRLTTPSQRKPLMHSLLSSIPSLQSATHNAWAYRIAPPPNSASLPHARGVREEAFDDGETGCGDLILRVMREVGAVDTLVVLTRWFGGTMLGPDRWRLMRRCVTAALAERLRRTGLDTAPAAAGGVGGSGEALWALDLEAARQRRNVTTVGGYGSGTRMHRATEVVGMDIHRPEGARAYLMKSFASVAQEEGRGAAGAAQGAEVGKSPSKKGKTQKVAEKEKEENLGLLLGALRIVMDSWADHLGPAELDRRAWGWYVAVRPDVDAGQAGWGAKGRVKLGDILKLKRPDK